MTTRQNHNRNSYKKPKIRLFAINAENQLMAASPFQGQHKPGTPNGIYGDAKSGLFLEENEETDNSFGNKL
jgi:hypothetical protein